MALGLRTYVHPEQDPVNVIIAREGDIDLQGAATQRVAAVNLTTAGGTVLATDVNRLLFTNPIFPAGVLQVLSPNTTGDTTPTALAVRLAQTINASASCARWGIYATSAAAVISIFHSGPCGNSTVITAVAGGTSTIVPAAAGVMAGGAGPVVVFDQFTAQLPTAGVILMQPRSLVTLVAGDVAALCAAGAPVA